MKYKFLGQPNMLVKAKKKGYLGGKLDYKPLFRFDEKGEYVTDDQALIEKLKSRFDCVAVPEEVAEEAGNDAQIPSLACPVCGFEATNKAGLSAHIRAKHKEV